MSFLNKSAHLGLRQAKQRAVRKLLLQIRRLPLVAPMIVSL